MNALVRCDATRDIGFGHLSRCIALAEALRLSGTMCRFAGEYDAPAREQILAAGFDCQDLSGPVNSEAGERDFATLAPPDFLILDSYRIDDDYLAALNRSGHTIVLFDDFHALNAYACSVILNFTVGATGYDYPEGPVVLRGPQYLAARRGLVEARAASIAFDRTGPVRNLLVAIGGSDPKRLASRLIGILRSGSTDICLQALAPDDPSLADMLGDFAPGSRILERQEDLSAPLLWADAAITGGGLIKYEAAYMGVPAAAIAQNEGQDSESQAFAQAGLVFDLGLADDVQDEQLAGALGRFLGDAQLRARMAGRMREAFPPDPSAHAARAILEALGRRDGR